MGKFPEVHFSIHALEQMNWREIERNQVELTLREYDEMVEVRPGRSVLQKTYEESGKIYMIRVFVDMDRDPPEVVTVYKTTKIEKYRVLQ